MVRALSAFLEFCHLVRRSVINERTLDAIDDALHHFHQERVIFETSQVCSASHLSPPRQHSMVHYRLLIEQFGAPNGLCSSITESKHIKAVKEPYCRSNCYNTIGQMLLSNQCLDKLAAARVDFVARGMLNGALLPDHLQDSMAQDAHDEDDDEGVVEGLRYVGEVRLAKHACNFFSL